MSGRGLVVCAVDVGSTFIKVAVYDANLRVLAQARGEFPADRAGDRVEADPERTWQAFAATVRSALAASPRPPQALVMSAQMAGLVLLDAGWRPLGPVILGLDRRGEAARTDPRTGCPPGAIYPNRKLAWLGSREPARLAAARYIGGVKEYLLQRLTAEWVTDPSSASATGLYDVTSGRWWDEAIEDVRITPGHLPRVVRPRDPVGALLPEAAQACAAPVGIPVVAGAGDGPAANLATGAAGPRLCLSLGTTVVARLLVRGRDVSGCTVPLFTAHVEGEWHCVGVRLDPDGDRYTPVGAPQVRVTVHELPSILRPLLDGYRVSRLRPTGSGSQDLRRLRDLASSWALPVEVTDAYDGTRGVALLAQHGHDDLDVLAARVPVVAEIQPEPDRCCR